MTTRKKRTAAQYIDSILNNKTAEKTGVVRRSIATLPNHLSVADLIAEVTRRNYKVLIGDNQFVIITDRNLTICN